MHSQNAQFRERRRSSRVKHIEVGDDVTVISLPCCMYIACKMHHGKYSVASRSSAVVVGEFRTFHNGPHFRRSIVKRTKKEKKEREREGETLCITNATFTEIKIEESDSQLILKVWRTFFFGSVEFIWRILRSL